VKLINNDCIEAMKAMGDNSVDSIVTDPPYELGFMGKSWDASGIAFNIEVWQEALRVLKPGGHLIAFSGSRTYHRMAVAIEDAGFQIRDQIMWVYGSGFPKSHNIAKALDKSLGVESEIVGYHQNPAKSIYTQGEDELSKEVPPLLPTSNEAKQWQGWGTALKPAHEPIVLARKPLIGTVAANVLTHGVGGLNIDGARVGTDEMTKTTSNGVKVSENRSMSGANFEREIIGTAIGRFPANFIHDGSDEVVALFPEATTGSAARFFYCAKASKRDRNEGLDGFDIVETQGGGGRPLENYGNDEDSQRLKKAAAAFGAIKAARANHHPTVKPTDLMRYLCRLITPPAGIVLDPFMGSGSTGKAAVLEGFDFIGIDQSAEYVEIAKARIAWAKENA